MGEETKRKDEFLKTQEGFKTNAFKIITKMVDWCNKTVGSKHLVDEILHSIFFLGKINKVPYSPEDIIPDKSLLDGLKEKYPRPFKYFQVELPKRSPFSCVLDMIVLRERPENENNIKQILKELIDTLEPGFLVSSTICVSKSNKSTQYGVSMSTTGPNPGRIVIAASCLSRFWDDYVASAVMTYYPEKKKKNYFDGTIKVPTDISCRAYSIKSGGYMNPCKSCVNLFGLCSDSKKEWPYGNCAEAESLSNLFKNDPEVKIRAKPGSDTCTPENRKRARGSVRDQLKRTLKEIQFNTWNGKCYNPRCSCSSCCSCYCCSCSRVL